MKLRNWDATDHLTSGQYMTLYLDTCRYEAGYDPAYMARCLGVAERAYRAALTEAATLTGAELGTPEGERLDVLAGIMVAYVARQVA